MPHHPSTPEGRVVLFHSSTGQASEHWPVDARDILAHGEHTLEMPEGFVPPAPPAPAQITLPTQKEYAPGVPAVVTHARDAGPGALTGATSKRTVAKKP